MRTTRNQTDLTKKRISDSMKRKHQERGEVERQQTAQKQSDSMRQYWNTIPTVAEKPSEKK